MKRARNGAILVLAAGGAGLLAAAAPLFFIPQVQVNPLEVLIAYLAVGWWAILMVLVGGIALVVARRAAGSPSQRLT